MAGPQATSSILERVVARAKAQVGAADPAALRFAHSSGEILLRRLTTDLVNALPYALYRPLADLAKRLRGRRRVATASPQDFDVHAPPATEPGAVVVLTHDIDTRACHEHWEAVLAIEAEHGMRSVSNVLTRGPYRLQSSFLDSIEADGFELGLHGTSHDMAIGFRRPAAMRRHLSLALDDLGRQVLGYRAPALAISHALIEELATLGFAYDSSMTLQAYYSTGVRHPFPFPVDTTGKLLQLPLTVQDDGLFRDRGLNEAQGLAVISNLCKALARVGGLLVFNSHPIHLKSRMTFYRGVLESLRDNPLVQVVTGRELVTCWNNPAGVQASA